MKPSDRKAWLLAWFKDPKHAVGTDILNAAFVDEYAEATGAKRIPVNLGAHHCPQLGRDLSALAREGALQRARLGLPSGSWQPGFPKWVWSYKFPEWLR